MQGDEKTPPYRAFVCQTLNEWNYPAKDRSGKLELLEEPHLGKLLKKINGDGNNPNNTLDFNLAKNDNGGNNA